MISVSTLLLKNFHSSCVMLLNCFFFEVCCSSDAALWTPCYLNSFEVDDILISLGLDFIPGIRFAHFLEIFFRSLYLVKSKTKWSLIDMPVEVINVFSLYFLTYIHFFKFHYLFIYIILYGIFLSFIYLACIIINIFLLSLSLKSSNFKVNISLGLEAKHHLIFIRSAYLNYPNL